jgi:hypothetical protein
MNTYSLTSDHQLQEQHASSVDRREEMQITITLLQQNLFCKNIRKAIYV